MRKLTNKKVISLNKKFGGSLINKGNLDFTLDSANHEKNIYKSNAKIVQGIINGHPFLDGNKRVTISLISKRFMEKNIKCNKIQMTKGIINIAKNQINDLKIIERRLRKWCPKK